MADLRLREGLANQIVDELIPLLEIPKEQRLKDQQDDIVEYIETLDFLGYDLSDELQEKV